MNRREAIALLCIALAFAALVSRIVLVCIVRDTCPPSTFYPPPPP